MDIDIFQLPAILRKRWYVIAAAVILCVGLALAYVLLHKPVYSASADILVDQQGLKSDGGELNIWGASPNQDQAIVDSQIYVLQSREILTAVATQLDLVNDDYFSKGAKTGISASALVATVTSLQKNVSVTRAGQSFILTVTVKHGNAEKAVLIADEIAKAYLKSVHGARSDASQRAASFFQSQAIDLQARVFKAEAELERFKAANGLVSTGQQGLLIDQQVEGVNRQLIEARGDAEQKRTVYEQVRNLTVSAIEAGAVPESLQSGPIGTLRSRYADLRSKETELATSLGASHPQMLAVRSQVASMKQALEQEVARLRQSMKSAYDRSQANLAAINGQLESLKKTSINSSEAGIRAKQLQSEADALRALYKTFLTKAEEFGQRDGVDTNNSRIISSAVPFSQTSFLMKIMVLFASGLFGVALGSGLAVLMEIVSVVKPSISAQTEPAVEAPTVTALAQPVVVATMPMNAKPASSLKTRLFSGLARAKTTPADVERQTRIAVTRAVDSLVEMQAGHGPVTALFLSSDHVPASPSVVHRIAHALNQLDKVVLYSTGENMSDAADPMLFTLHPEVADVGNIIPFQKLGSLEAELNQRAAPTYANFRKRNRKADFIIVDATGNQVRDHLQALLKNANAIVLVADEGTDNEKLKALVQSLSPWQDVMLGTILIPEAA